MTSDGGKDGEGTVFDYNLSAGDYQTICSFAGPKGDGEDGLDNVFISNGAIFGMTKYGGDNATGTTIKGNPAYLAGVILSIPLPTSSS